MGVKTFNSLRSFSLPLRKKEKECGPQGEKHVVTVEGSTSREEEKGKALSLKLKRKRSRKEKGVGLVSRGVLISNQRERKGGKKAM